MRRALVRVAGVLALAGTCATLLRAWVAPDNVLALWSLVALCR
jgi:hypothetical protein